MALETHGGDRTVKEWADRHPLLHAATHGGGLHAFDSGRSRRRCRPTEP